MTPAAAGGRTRAVILTGVSGSGKSTALRALEDADWYCVDNLPVVLLDKLVELGAQAGGQIQRLALVVDARDERFLPEAPRIIEEVRRSGTQVDVLFLEASDETLLRRYSETRRRHPMAGEGGSVPEGIAAERRALAPLKAVAGEVVDTTAMNVHQLKSFIHSRFLVGPAGRLGVTVVSFGFRYGVPSHADLVLDVRFLPNPYFVPELKPHSGLDPAVRDFVLGQPDARTFLDKLADFGAFLLPRYAAEGKSYLTLAIGCTGGRHRSVALAEELARRLGEGGTEARVWHRDVDKE
jgi:RNase adapter protein RapZ